MKNKMIVIAAALGLLSILPGKSHAQDFDLTLRLTAITQRLENQQIGRTNSPRFKSTVHRIRITNKDVLALAALAVGDTNQFADHTLVLNSAGEYLVLDNQGAIAANLTGAGIINNFFADDSDSVQSGISNTNINTRTSTTWRVNRFAFLDVPRGNSFDVAGLQTEQSRLSRHDRFRDSFLLTGAGTGTITTAPQGANPEPFFIVTGSVSGQRRGILTPPL